MDAVRSVTRNLPELVQTPLIAILGRECYTTLVYNVDFKDTDCLRVALSKGIGLGILGGSSMVKVPQIQKIVSAKSARGISLLSYLLDTASLLVNVAYNFRNNFPFTAYGENVALLVQNAVITGLILTYGTTAARTKAKTSSSNAAGMLAFVGASAAGLYALLAPSITSMDVLRNALTLSIPVSLLSKIPQIWTNMRNGSTGQMSAIVVAVSLVGCLARLFTTSEETGDKLLFWNFALAAGLNAILLLQVFIYWNNTGKTESQAIRKADMQEQLVAATPQTPAKTPITNSKLNSPAPNRASTRSPSGKQWVRKAD